MGRRELIARSIVRALTIEKPEGKRSLFSRIFSIFATFLSLFELPLRKLWSSLFTSLRVECWGAKDDDYKKSFVAGLDEKPEDALKAIGDMGYSGSTFFASKDQRWLIKSVPRYFEHSFFRDDLLDPYATYMSTHTTSLLIRICDFLASPYYPIGSLLGLAPTHHIVMENILYGQEAASAMPDSECENWDLKPTSYFFPERDIAAGKLTSEATKSKLADKFEDKVILSKAQAEGFWQQLEEDTELLSQSNAVDYSLFLVRIRTEVSDPFADPSSSSVVPTEAPFVPPDPPSWRTGVQSPDGKHIYRAAVLDFFWAKHKTQPRLMTMLVTGWNTLVSRQGHMSITTTPAEYRERFLKMCKEIVEIAPGSDP